MRKQLNHGTPILNMSDTMAVKELLQYRKEFLLRHKSPYRCYFCKQTITTLSGRNGKDTLVIHHKDGNSKNNTLKNLVPAHWGCHVSYHNMGNQHTKGHKLTPEHIAKITAHLPGNQHRKGKKSSPETCARVSEAGKGRRHSLETRLKMAEARRKWWSEKRGH